VGLFAAGWWLAPDPLWARVAFKSALMLAFPLLLLLTGFFSAAERRRLARFWQRAV
jgi:hypothetical protein